MSNVCPQGHRSSTADYCDQCGARIAAGPTALAAQPTEVLPSVTAVVAAPVPAEPCPSCGAARLVGDLFCESCGFDFSSEAVAPPDASTAVPVRWTAVVAADREHFERVAPDGMDFPTDFAPLTFALEEDELRLGRTAAGGDPAVSRVHAILVRQDDGSYAIVDRGSTNGTTVNDDPTPIAPDSPMPLADGDCIHIGAWTTITLHAESET